MFWLAAEAAFTERLADDCQLSQRKLANAVLTEAASVPVYPPEGVATVPEIDAPRACRGLDAIGWQLMTKLCPDLYRLLCRPLSMEGTHTNLDVIQSFMQVGGGGRIVGPRAAPLSLGWVMS